MKLKQVRRRWRTENQRLRRARKLYIRLTYEAFRRVPPEKRDVWIDHIADAALFHGMWSTGYPSRSEQRRNVRYALYRGWYKIDQKYDKSDWHSWYEFRNDHGLKSVSFRTVVGVRLAKVG